MTRKLSNLSIVISILWCASLPAQNASISGLVWMDDDRDGTRDATEPTISNVTVELFDSTNVGTPIRTTQTIDGGTYGFMYDPATLPGFNATSNPDPPVFVRFILPSTDLEFTTQNVGPEERDSDADLNGDTADIRLEQTETLRNIDAGMRTISTTDTTTDNGTTDNGTGDNGTTDNTTTDNTANNVVIANTVPAGVAIDATGVLRVRRQVDTTRELSRQRARQMRASMDPVLLRPSASRKVCLNRLEKAVAESLKTSDFINDEMAFLAGLTRIEYVFLFPESGDLVIAGPAEGFAPNDMGRIVGMKSGQATLQLQDLIVALRCFMPGERPTPLIGCSIDPTPEGLERMQKFIANVAGRLTPADDVRFADGLRKSLGPQIVSVQGVPPNTHFAQVLIEADYRMKLIGIGLEQPPVYITSYIKRASPSSVARNALQRWYFVPDYDAVRVSDDGSAMELVGEGVKLVGEDERVQQGGQRVQSRRVDRASSAFVRSFTQRYQALARKEPVFGQLRNLIDLSILAAYLQQEDVYGQLGWEMRFFADESIVPVEVFRSPKTVEPVVNVVWKGNTLMTPIGGGVSIETAKALAANRVLSDEDGSLEDARKQVSMPQLADGQWWWD